MSTSRDCPFYLGRTSKERHAELYAEIEAKYPCTNAKAPQTGAGRKNIGKKKVGFGKPDAEGFVPVLGGIAGVACIDTIPSPPPPPPVPSPSPPASIKHATGSILGAIADEALCPELKGNEEARRLMQETLLDEAAFAAADARDAPENKNSSGSPPLRISYA
ncbi:hypothetical protein AX14_009088 [Amanita brunnescens Koide BX004]|nr:hypothetical protein AX14_009088 [Amanita brunnescens Koide BX004]